jgi:transposase
MPLYYDVYEGNRNDAKQFPLMLKRFHEFFRNLSQDDQGKQSLPNTTLIFDKGNNSKDNFKLLDDLHLSYVGSVKLEEHKELARIKNSDARFESTSDHPEGTKSFRVKKTVYGKERLLLVTFNQNLFHSQWLTVQNDVRKALQQLSELSQRLEDRRMGLIKGGRCPTTNSVIKQCQSILSRQYMKELIPFTVTTGSDGIPHLEHAIDTDAQSHLCETYLGKNLLITDHNDWSDAHIIHAYRSQFIIEAVFKEMKDRQHGSWWPMFHWTDSKIRVHALYCTIALLLRALISRRVRQAGLRISLDRLLNELDALREVVNFYPRQRGQKTDPGQAVLTKMTELQQRLVTILNLKREETVVLG